MNALSNAFQMKKEWVNGAIQLGQKKGGYKVKSAIRLKEGNSLNAPKGLIAWVASHHGTKMYSFDCDGNFWSAIKSEAYQSACQSGQLMIAADH